MKVLKKQSKALIIKYPTNIFDDLEEAYKVPVATYIQNMQWQKEYRTLAKRIKHIKGRFRKQVLTLSPKNKPTELRWKSQRNYTGEGYNCRKLGKVPPYQRSLPITWWPLVVLIYWSFWQRPTGRSYYWWNISLIKQHQYRSENIIETPTTTNNCIR